MLLAKLRCEPPPGLKVENALIHRYGFHVMARKSGEWVIYVKTDKSKKAPPSSADKFDTVSEATQERIKSRLNKLIDFWANMDAKDNSAVLYHCRCYANQLSDVHEREYAQQYIFNNVG